MKILMIMYGKGIGGAELQFIELARELARKHKVCLASMGGDGAIRSVGLPHSTKIKVFRYSNRLSALFGVVRAWLVLPFMRPDVVITTSFGGNVLGYAINLLGRAKLVSLQTVSKVMRYPKIDRFILSRFDCLVAGSRDIRDYLVSHGQRTERIEVVNNWVDFSNRKVTADSVSTRTKFGIGANETVIGCIGRLHYQKGQEFLIRAFRALQSRKSNLRLVLVGDGPKAEDMRAEASGLGEAVIFTGSVMGDDYNNLLNAFDIYVQPSRFEGLPRTLLDAMFLEKPIVATAVNGNLDALRDGSNGLLVPAESQEALAAAIQSLLDDSERSKTLARQAHLDAVAFFDMDTQLKRIEKVLG